MVVPTHRRPAMLEGALRSALAQTLTDLEVVVCVDGEDPEGVRVARSFEDPRLRVLADGTARGEALNTLRGIEGSTSPYFAVLHDDDEWEPEMLARLVPPLQADPALAVAFGDHWLMGPDGDVLARESEENSRRYGRDRLDPGAHRPFHRLTLVQQAVPAVMTSVFRRSAVRFDDLARELPANFDYWLAWLAARSGGGAHYVPRRLSRYRVHAGQGTCTARPSWARAEVAMMTRLLSEPGLQDLRPELARRLAAAHRQDALHRHRAGEPRAWRGALRSLRARPSAKGVAALGLTCLPPPVLERVGRALSR
ncbi:glycosyltransferase family 2 protein [Kineococcus sp. SYSU DK005]|uniref:glycosyltransferase family 2 protein n=1 Tax=Kineococcus sp. SYSU DK005 TaxID=3383126 RepID=UPI003D7ED323